MNLRYVLKNWSILLLNQDDELLRNSQLRQSLKNIFELKANGSEEEYIAVLRYAGDVRKMLQNILKNNNS